MQRKLARPSWFAIAWILILVAGFAALVGARYIPGEGFTALIQFDSQFAVRADPVLAQVPHHVRSPTGYDGQFYAQLALDPTLRDPRVAAALDSPGYRARRIFLPATAYALGLGNPYWVVNIYAVLNIGFWALLLALLIKYYPPASVKVLGVYTVILFSTGTLESVRLALTDLPATVMMLGAVVLSNRASGPLFSAACLTRETSVLAALTYVGGKRTEGVPVWRKWAATLVILLPAVVWFGYVAWRYSNPIEGADTNLGVPFMHVVEALVNVVHTLEQRFSSSALFAPLAIVGLFTQAIYLWRKRDWADPLWRVGAPFAVLLCLLDDPVWEMHTAACRAVLPLTFAFNLLLLKEEKNFWFWLILGNAYSVFGIYKFATYVS